ncbi:UNVERIFIED_CONTAM: hypothetical protein Scaly_1015800 [Sesamum calycinum]|uniref:Retrovirus-related Pol polyprotein from transposon TNT 1-94 n=1 Tax=Sesamum calycinum TaxID=2727403 RepID=A0AAW2QJJ4_9LAMI
MSLTMKSGESIVVYFSRVMAITNKMRIFEDKSEDIIIIEKILRSLTPKFNFVVCAIEESKNIDKLSLDELQSSLLVHEQKFKQQDNEEQALTASTGNPSTSKGGRGGETQPNLWYLDTSYSNHMCGDKGIFFELDETFRNTVKFGNNSTLSVMGKGNITLQTKGDIIHNIFNALCSRFEDQLTKCGSKRTKLDDKGEKCIFLSVYEQSKAYKLYNPITKKVVIGRDVSNEAEFWSHEKCKPEQRIQVDFEDGDEVTGQQVEINDKAIDIQEILPVSAVERAQQIVIR